MATGTPTMDEINDQADKLASNGKHAVNDAADAASDAASVVADTGASMADKASSAAAAVGDKASAVAATVGDTASAVAARLPDVANAASVQVGRAGDVIRGESDEVLAVGTSLSLGFAAGLLFGGANRFLVILALIPATAMGYTLFDRHNDGPRASRRD